ncbi:MAG: hypothetical protein V7K32_14315 [Nostoc sp.]
MSNDLGLLYILVGAAMSGLLYANAKLQKFRKTQKQGTVAACNK